MNALPMGWVKTTLDQIVDRIVGGGTPSKSNASFFRGSIPFMTVKDMTQRFPVDTQDHISEKAIEQSATTVVARDTLIVATRMSLGKIVRPKFETAINQDLKALFLNENIDKTFVEYWWRHKAKYIQSLGTGTTVQGIRLEAIRSLSIHVPPLNEQKHIADKLDTLLTRVDTCRSRLERIPLILKRFRQAVLAAATSGQFTEDWREENFDIEPATNLVKQKRFTLAASDDNLPLLPDNWEWVALGNYAQCSRGRFSVRPRNDPAYFNGEHPFIQIGNLPSEGGWITAHKQTLNEKGLAVSKKFPKGTVVIAIVGATIGNTGILAYDMCFTDSMVGIDSGDEISNRYIELFLRHRKEEIRQTSYAGGGQPNIKLQVLNPYPLALPPLAEQHEIVCRVEVLFAYADRLEARYQAARTQVERLTPALLAKAFRGELVSQDSNDEPASMMLERIRAQRATQPSKPKRSPASRKQTMTKMTEESVKEAIRQLPNDKFSFDELRENLPGDYESLKNILFKFLSEAEPSLTQTFDRDERTMCFVRAGK